LLVLLMCYTSCKAGILPCPNFPAFKKSLVSFDDQEPNSFLTVLGLLLLLRRRSAHTLTKGLHF